MGAISDDDLRKISQAVAIILNSSQQYLAFPVPQPPPPKGRARGHQSAGESALSYSFYGNLTVELSSDWEICPGFILQAASLNIGLRMSGNAGGNTLDISLGATLEVDDVLFMVKGQIPDLLSDSEVEFILTLTLMDNRITTDARNLVRALDSTLDFDKAISGASSDVIAQLVDEGSSVLSARVVVHRTPAKPSYLKSIELLVMGGFDWTPVENITLKRVGCTAIIRRDTVDSPWNYLLQVAGLVGIKTADVLVKAEFDSSETKTITLSAAISPSMNLTAIDVMDLVVRGTGKVFVPPNLEYMRTYVSRRGALLEVEIVLSLSTAMAVQSCSVAVQCPGAIWSSPPSEDHIWPQVFLSDLNIFVTANSSQAQTFKTNHTGVHSQYGQRLCLSSVSKTRVTNSWDYSAYVRGTIHLRDEQYALPAVLTYDSSNKETWILARITDYDYGSLTDLAGDNAFVPYDVVPPDLVAISTQYPVPNESPVQLILSGDPVGGRDRSIRLRFNNQGLTRVLLKAQYSNNDGWQISSQMTLLSLGIMFDLTDPVNADETKRIVTGYVYGFFRVINTAVVAFVAGSKTVSGTEFWAHLSAQDGADLDPVSALNISPTVVLSDPQMTGYAPPLNGWNLPTTFPIKIEAAFSSSGAQLDVQFKKLTGTSSYSLRLVNIVVYFSEKWTVYDSLVLPEGSLTVLISNAGDQATMQARARLVGSLSLLGPGLRVQVWAEFWRNGPGDDIFHAQVDVKTLNGGAGVAASTIYQLQQFGGQTLDLSRIPSPVPADYPIQLSDFMSTSKLLLSCGIDVTRNTEIGSLTALYFTLSQGGPWVITDRIALDESSLELVILNPLGPPSNYQLTARGRLKIGGGLNINATVKLLTGTDQRPGWLRITVSIDNHTDPLITVGSVLSVLVPNATIDVPSGCPIDPNKPSMSATLVINFAPNGTKWVLKDVVIEMQLAASITWSIGPSAKSLLVTKLGLNASLVGLDTTSSTQTVIIYGEAALQQSSTNILRIAARVDESKTLTVSLQALIDTQVQATAILSNYCGDWRERSDIPQFSNDSGLSDYGSLAIVSAQVRFLPSGQNWTPDSLSVSVQTGSGFPGWSIVDGYLKLTNLKLNIYIDNLSSNPGFTGRLFGLLKYTARSSKTPLASEIHLTLDATQKVLSLNIQLPDCSFMDAIYVATAGRFNLPGSWWPTLSAIMMKMNWIEGSGSFTAILGPEAILPGTKKIFVMLHPTLFLGVSKSTSNFAAVGQLSGTAEVFATIDIPISYDLPNGPLKIFGIDVKKIYDMVKALWDLVKDVEQLTELCEIMAEVAGVAAASAVGTALVALGVEAAVVWSVIKSVFGSSGGGGGGGGGLDDSGGSNENPDSNKYTGLWVVGGSGINNGTVGEQVELKVYPKDAWGNGLAIDKTQLTATIISETRVPVKTWVSQGPSSYLATYSRPTTLGGYIVSITYPPLNYEAQIPVISTDTPGTASRLSLLDAPLAAVMGIHNQATIWPRDSRSTPLYGLAFEDLYKVTFTPPTKLPVKLVTFNDALKVDWVPSQTSHMLGITLEDGTPITGSPLQIQCVLRPSTKLTKAAGPGLCTGYPGDDANFDVTVLDDIGNPYNADPGLTVLAVATTQNGHPTPQITETRRTGNKVSFQYIFPNVNCIISISIDGLLLEQCPINVATSTHRPGFSVTASTVTLSQQSYYVGQTLTGTITARDDLGYLWIMENVGTSFRVLRGLDLNSELGISSENGDGTVSFSYTLSSTPREDTIVVCARSDPRVQATGSPVDFKINSWPALQELRCYGPAMELPTTLPYFDILPFDEAESIVQESQLWDPSELHVASTYNEISNVVIKRKGRGYRATVQPAAKHPDLSIPPVVRVSRSSVDFGPGPYLMDSAPPTANALAFWRKHVQDNISSFLVTAASENGNRRYMGGDIVSVLSQSTSQLVVTEILDRLDGSYLVSYVPLGASQMQVAVAVNGIPATGSPYTLPDQSDLSITLEGDGLFKASIGISAQFTVKVLRNKQPMVDNSVYFTGLVYPVSSTDANAAVVIFSAPDTYGAFEASYILGQGTLPGNFKLRLLANFQPFANNIYDVVVTMPASVAEFDITGLDTLIQCTDSRNLSQEFIITPYPVTECQPKDLKILCSPSIDFFYDITVFGDRNTQFAVRYGVTSAGTYTLRFNFRGQAAKKHNAERPDDDSWLVVASDAMRSLTRYVPGRPEMSWSTKQEGPGKPGAVVLPDGNLQLSTQSGGPNALLSAQGGWKIPGFGDTSAGFLFGFRVALSQFDAPVGEMSFTGPLIRKGNGPYPVLQLAAGQNIQWTTLGTTGSSGLSGPSSILPDGVWHYVVMRVNSSNLWLFEDSKLIFNMPTGDSGSYASPFPFDLSFFTDTLTNAFAAQIKDIFTCPGSIRPSIRSPSDGEVYFNSGTEDQEGQLWTVVADNIPGYRYWYNATSLSLSTGREMLTNVGDSYTFAAKMIGPALQPVSAVQCLFRVYSIFEGTGIFAFHRGVGLEIVKPLNGVITCDYYYYGKDEKGVDKRFHLQSTTSFRDLEQVIVTVLYSQTAGTVTLFENGNLRINYTFPNGIMPPPQDWASSPGITFFFDNAKSHLGLSTGTWVELVFHRQLYG
ncbi:uncharacterized protein FTJAE_10801 [Fusarium tjaetaba]|uniref:Uncharacterized protein n=1 Tax=Fusarium tjaetaba TaxID=1567544 RepID=A0A8H5QXK4_9HYPO|nr:uncharacterized protein FTJAE_10801 [Fusarium tjaetaba]KAF5622678.1 hypothetical protein FTJAE_10801 [Fusarium tjaetaba]